MVDNDNLLSIKGLTLDYPGVRALDSVDIEIKKGTVHILVGENGAGKTTLVKIITGAVTPTKLEEMIFDGSEVRINNPSDSLGLGISVVSQHFGLIEGMTVAENIFLGNYQKKGVLLDYNHLNSKAQEMLDELGLDIKPNWAVSDLTPGDKQAVEILKAVALKPKLLLMDEPTSGLKQNEIDQLFSLIARLKEKGTTFLYISHRLEETFEIGDFVTILRNGSKVADRKMTDISHDEMTTFIVGKNIADKYPKSKVEIGDVALKIENLENTKTKVKLKNINFEVCKGEIFGVYGILGSGKNELANTIFGLNPATGGSISINGDCIDLKSCSIAIEKDMGYVSENRHYDGMLEYMTVKENQTIASLKDYCRGNHIIKAKEEEISDSYINTLGIRTPSRNVRLMYLSGGNQQKVIFSRWIIANSKILILNEPTVGVDVGSKVEVFRLMVEEAKKGRAILLISSELDEVYNMSDRIAIMLDGEIIKECIPGEISKNEMLKLATKKEEIGRSFATSK